MVHNKQTQSGFALLITVLLLSVVVTVTISIVDLTQRQVRLAVDSRDAEVAFQAATAGVECAQRIARTASSTIRNGDNINFDCFNISRPDISNQSSGAERVYSVQITWDNRCTEIDLIVLNNETSTTNLSLSNIRSRIANFPRSTLECPGGSTCHVVASAGYNVSCWQVNANLAGVLKREILLEF